MGGLSEESPRVQFEKQTVYRIKQGELAQVAGNKVRGNRHGQLPKGKKAWTCTRKQYRKWGRRAQIVFMATCSCSALDLHVRKAGKTHKGQTKQYNRDPMYCGMVWGLLKKKSNLDEAKKKKTRLLLQSRTASTTGEIRRGGDDGKKRGKELRRIGLHSRKSLTWRRKGLRHRTNLSSENRHSASDFID